MVLSITTQQHNTMPFNILFYYSDQNMWQCMFQKLVQNIAFNVIKCSVNKENPQTL